MTRGFDLLVLALSLLAVLRPPNALLWMVGLGVAELGWLWGLLILRFGRRRPVLLIAAALLLSPTLRAIPIAIGMEARMRAAFGPTKPDGLQAGGAPRLRTLEYARRGQDPLLLDLYDTEGRTKGAPLVVFIHGGGWRQGSRSEFPHLVRTLAGQGYSVASLDYRLAPDHPFPAAIDDVIEAVEFLRGRSDELGLDRGPIAIGGRSAGAHLALLAGVRLGRQRVRGVFAMYGPVDLVWGYENPSRRRLMDSKSILAGFLGGTPEQARHAYLEASPLFQINASTPPTLIVQGGNDQMVSPHHAEAWAARMTEAGRPHLELILPWATHGCDAVWLGPCGLLTERAVGRFLAATPP